MKYAIKFFLCCSILLVIATVYSWRFVRKPTIVSQPLWSKSSIFYGIFVRSYFDTNNDGIGDLKGIEQQLPYLKRLGIGAIVLTPIFKAKSYHGYDTIDYFSIQPEYGTTEDLAGLVRSAHAMGIRIVLDFVAGHVSQEFDMFTHAKGNLQSDFTNWFLWQNEEHTKAASSFDSEYLIRLNTYDPQVRKYLVAVAEYWMKTTNIDGYRCDFTINTPDIFWNELRSGVKKINPDALLIADAWATQSNIDESYANGFDATFDYASYASLLDSNSIIGNNVLSGSLIPDLLDQGYVRNARYDKHEAQRIFFLNTHDTNRIFSYVSEDLRRAKIGALLLMTGPDIPMIYYGEEIGMSGKKKDSKAIPGVPDDKPVRSPMRWFQDLRTKGQTTWYHDADGRNAKISIQLQESDEESLLSFYKKLTALRNTYSSFNFGTYMRVDNKISPFQYVYIRYDDHNMFVVAINTSEVQQPMSVNLPDTIPIKTLKPILEVDGGSASVSGHIISGVLPPVSGMMWRVE